MKKYRVEGLFLSLAAVLCFLQIGCDKAKTVDLGKGKYVVYNYKNNDVNRPTAKSTASTGLSQEEKKWSEVYEARHQARPTAAVSAPARPALTPPLASKENIEYLKKRITELKGTYKLARNGAIISLKVSGSADGSGFNSEDMDKTGQLYDLESIFLEGSVFDDDYIAKMKDLKKLTSITINNSNIKDASLEVLATLPELKTLDIRRDLMLENSSLEILQKMPKLETLLAYYNKFTNSGMNKISKVKTLKVVDVRGCPDVSDNGAKYLARLPLVEELYFRGSITNEGIQNLAQAPKLRFVEFQDCNEINDMGIDAFKSLKTLTELRLFRCKGISDETVKGIASMPFVRLELRDLNLSNEGILALKGKTTLKAIELAELPGVDAAGLNDLLSSLPALEDLNLFAIPFDDACAKTVAEKLPNLKSLTLRSVSMSNAGLESILKLSKLEVLDLRENDSFSPVALLNLSKLGSLKRLYLNGTSLALPENANSLKQLQSSLPKCNIAY
ncbi:MAG: hypothetical protein Q4G69_05390 [Planctomycetia bacterium]|nr:hypothetical protein [Planctomycetia bacterium]